MIDWLQAHALECLVAAYLFSAIVSVMPPLSRNASWGTTWMYAVLQVLGANAGSLVKHSPAGAQVESVLESQVHVAADGAKTTTEIKAVKVPETVATTTEAKP